MAYSEINAITKIWWNYALRHHSSVDIWQFYHFSPSITDNIAINNICVFRHSIWVSLQNNGMTTAELPYSIAMTVMCQTLRSCKLCLNNSADLVYLRQWSVHSTCTSVQPNKIRSLNFLLLNNWKTCSADAQSIVSDSWYYCLMHVKN